MNIPINGRVAIVEDQWDDAQPLIEVLSSHRIPFSYFSGDSEHLPKTESTDNDIRLLLLDLNLVSREGKPQVQQVYAKLKEVLSSLISTDNYPYSVIIWSRQTDVYAETLEEAFKKKEELLSIAPIAITYLEKSTYIDFDPITGVRRPSDKIGELFTQIKVLLEKQPSFGHLIDWENKVHIAADQTLQELFPLAGGEGWESSAKGLLNNLGIAYAGKHFKDMQAGEKIKSSLNALSVVVNDTLDSIIYKGLNVYSSTHSSRLDSKSSINSKLLTSNETSPVNYPGGVVIDDRTEKKDFYRITLVNSLVDETSRAAYVEESLTKELRSSSGDKERKPTKPELKAKREEEITLIRKTVVPVMVYVTPLCDFVWMKSSHNRVVQGLLIPSQYSKYIDTKSEAIFQSPNITIPTMSGSFVLVLHFRHFFTVPKPPKSKKVKPLFRVRQQLLAEIQSKLARHVSRQGVLFLD